MHLNFLKAKLFEQLQIFHGSIIILKNHTHVKKVGHTSEFLFGIYDELQKQLFIKKSVEVDQSKAK